MVYESMTPEDVLVNHSGGGGGWGDPFERDPAAVLADVLNEYVSLDAARDDYGVVIDPATMTVDAAATSASRAER
jgi:N-methylhydantoinase B